MTTTTQRNPRANLFLSTTGLQDTTEKDIPEKNLPGGPPEACLSFLFFYFTILNAGNWVSNDFFSSCKL